MPVCSSACTPAYRMVMPPIQAPTYMAVPRAWAASPVTPWAKTKRSSRMPKGPLFSSMAEM